MLGSEILEVAIGIMFVYALVSIICTAVREGIEAFLKSRGAYLEYGIRELLNDRGATGIARHFYNHPLIYGLYSGKYKPKPSEKRPGAFVLGGDLPSYIPAKNFALALMDMAARGPETDIVSSDPNSPALTLESVRANVLNLRNESLQRVILTAIDSAEGDLNRAVRNLQAWFDSSMDRVSGWYKRSTQHMLFAIGLVAAIGLNVDTIAIAEYLYRNEAVRTALVARAEEAAKDTTFQSINYGEAVRELNSLSLPIGWTQDRDVPPDEVSERGAWQTISPLLGWLMTAFAATLGAPFWFDLLNKIMVIRSTVKPHEKSPEEGSEDRQPRRRPPDTGAIPGALSRRAAARSQALVMPEAVQPSTPRDAESGIDACDIDFDDETPDEELPPAEGGVAE